MAQHKDKMIMVDSVKALKCIQM